MQQVKYTPSEIDAYRKSFERRISNGDPAAQWEYALWNSVVYKVTSP